MLKVIKAANAAAPTEILLYDTIGEDPFFGGGVSAKAFSSALREAKKGPIDLRIAKNGTVSLHAPRAWSSNPEES